MSAEKRISIPQKSIATLRTTPYAEVAAAFNGFVVPSSEGRFRGGIPVDKPTLLDKCPYSAEWGTFSQSYSLESSFTLLQRRFAKTALHCLDEVAKGETKLGAETRYSEIVKSATLQASADFRFALFEADMTLFRYFEQLNPNLMPAMEVVFKLAGLAGLTEAADTSANYLARAVSGDLTSTNLEQFIAEDVIHSRFVGAKKGGKPRDVRKADFGFAPTDPYKIELRCLGELAAKTLIRESAVAAIDLAQPPLDEAVVSVLNYYNDDEPWQTDIAIDHMLSLGMNDLARLAKQRSRGSDPLPD